MALDYETQYDYIFPVELYSLREIGTTVTRIFGPPDAPHNRLQLFVRAETVAALNLADIKIKDMLREHDFGLVRYRGGDMLSRAQFIAGQAVDIIINRFPNNVENQKRALIELHVFVRNGMQRNLLDKNPFAEVDVPVKEPFDLAAALKSMALQATAMPGIPTPAAVSPKAPRTFKKLFGRQ